MHHTPQRIENSLGCEVLGGNEVDEVLLTFFLLDGLSMYSTLIPMWKRTFWMISWTAGSTSSRDAESNYTSQVSSIGLQPKRMGVTGYAHTLLGVPTRRGDIPGLRRGSDGGKMKSGANRCEGSDRSSSGAPGERENARGLTTAAG